MRGVLGSLCVGGQSRPYSWAAMRAQHLKQSGSTKSVMWSFGANSDFQLGLGEDPSKVQAGVQPIEAMRGEAVAKIAAGHTTGAAVTLTGDVWIWGKSSPEALGLTRDVAQGPEISTTLQHLHVLDIGLGRKHTVIIAKGGENPRENRLLCMGSHDLGQCGVGEVRDSPAVDTLKRSLGEQAGCYEISNVGPSPVEIESLRGVRAVACGLDHTLAIVEGPDSVRELWGWGNGTEGQLGIGKGELDTSGPRVVTAPTKVDLPRVMKVASSYDTTAAIDSEGRLYTWGCNDSGQLGYGEVTSPQLVPRLVEALKDKRVMSVAVGGAHIVAVTSECEVYTWGLAEDNRLGLPNITEKPGYYEKPLIDDSPDAFEEEKEHVTRCLTLPTLVGALQGRRVVHVAAGIGHAVAMSESGQLYAFGNSSNGRLGGSTGGLVQIPGQARQVVCGTEFTLVAGNAKRK